MARPVPAGELLSQVDRFEAVSADLEYRLLGVRLESAGPFLRETVSSTETSASRLNQVKEGDFIYSRLFAWRGAFGVISAELDGCFVSNEFPIFRVNQSRMNTGFLNYWFRLPAVWKQVEDDCSGSTPLTRNRFKEQFFFALKIPLPSLDEQRAIVARLDAVAEKARQVETKLDEIEVDAERLLAIRFREAIDGAEWRPMAEVAPLIRREVQIELEGNYPELGIRSFGKGTFHKAPLDGADVGTKRLFRIEPGDLLFSNVFAWEGAIAVAKPNDTGRFGSHRFMSCVANPGAASPEFLRYYFLTPQGLEKISEASPGGAGRNRTLGLEKLMALQVPVPTLAKQQAFDTLQTKVAEIKAKHTKIRESLKALLPSMLEQIFHNAD